ncbi:hypothetical protein ACN27E_16390 [Mycobacterium sp. WMMD1722]|uniref:hypothetical protein n=1 Tax=Mycobacterium sp. WMMD1722 TaxID=3404117 RepID=UPI003BF5E579
MAAFAEALARLVEDSGDPRLDPIAGDLADLDALAAPARYRRVQDAVARLRAVAVHSDPGEAIAEFLAGDDAVLARMCAAVDVLQAAGLRVDPADSAAAHLRRAVHWRAYSRGPVTPLHRDCGLDVCRGSLRLLSRRPAGTGAPRTELQRARVRLTYLVRNRCADLRAELHDDVAELDRDGFERFTAHTRRRVAQVGTELDAQITAQLRRVADELHLRPPPVAPFSPVGTVAIAAPARRTRRLENRLVRMLGAGFGLGVALAIGRLFSGTDAALAVVGLIAGGITGLAATVWVVGARGLLHDRAALDRWVGQACATLRSAMEERVAIRLLDAESAMAEEVRARRRARHFPGAGEFAAHKPRVTEQ